MDINGKYNSNQGVVEIIQNGDHVVANYQESGVCCGILNGKKLEGIWKNKKDQGLFEWTFENNGSFSGKYKTGLEAGAMRGRWDGSKEGTENNSAEKQNDADLNLFITKDELSKLINNIADLSANSRKEFSKQLVEFTRVNQEYLWLLPCYLNIVQGIENEIDDGEREGDISGFYRMNDIKENLNTRIFSKQALYFDDRSLRFAWNEEDETEGLMNLLLQDMSISIEELIDAYKADISSPESLPYVKFINMLRTVLYATIVRAFYADEYSNEDIANIIISPLEDELVSTIEENTSSFGDGLYWALEDVMWLFGIDMNHEDYDEDWNNYSKNYEKMAETICNEEAFDTPLIEL